MLNFSNVILLVAAVLTALIGGLFYAWSCSVMVGFARLKDKEFVAAMQSCNRAIQNPIFFTSFFGAPIFLIAAAFFHYSQPTRFWFLLSATVIFLIGTFGVTIAGNVPLNNQLDRFDLESATDEQVSLQRKNFESRWNNLNTIRTVSSIISIILVIAACLNF